MNFTPRRRPFQFRSACGRLLGVGLLAFSLCGCRRDETARVPVDAAVLESYAGQYQPDPKTTVEVKRRGDHLEMAINHQSPMTFVPEPTGGFIHRESSTRIRFGKGANGEVDRLELIRDGRTHEAPRVSPASAPNAPVPIQVGATRFQFTSKAGAGPTVILWGPPGAWDQVQPAVAAFAAVASFDRKKASGEAPAPVPATPGAAAHELHDALAAAQLAPPYVIVGHSFGGALARVFAHQYPSEVAGLVLVDPFQEGFLEWLKAHQPDNHAKLMAPMREHYATDWPKTLVELRAATSFPRLPTALLSASLRQRQTGNALEQGISDAALAEGSAAVEAAHREWLKGVAMGRQITVENSSHDIPHDRPDAVIGAIRQIVEQARQLNATATSQRQAP